MIKVIHETLSECNQVCLEPCVQEVSYNGSCDHTGPAYYYHAFKDRCYPFSDGCPAVRGAENSFVDLQTCLDTCRKPCDNHGVSRFHQEAWDTSDCQACQCSNVSCSPPNTPSLDQCSNCKIIGRCAVKDDYGDRGRKIKLAYSCL